MRACPFCGSVGALDYDGGDENTDQSWHCKCQGCGAQTAKFFGSNSWEPDTQAKRDKDRAARSNALYAWERRVPGQRGPRKSLWQEKTERE